MMDARAEAAHVLLEHQWQTDDGPTICACRCGYAVDFEHVPTEHECAEALALHQVDIITGMLRFDDATALLTPGTRAAASERRRQIRAEGFSVAHDRGRAPELLRASRAYLHLASIQAEDPAFHMRPEFIPESWPWIPERWHPEPDPFRMIDKGTALAIAAYDALALGD